MPRRWLPGGADRAGGRVLHPGRVERRPPAALVVARELEVEALVSHTDGDPTDAGPGVEPRAERPESVVIRWPLKPGETECCSQEPSALVEHGLLNHLIRPQQDRLRNRQAEGLGRLQFDDEVKLRCLLDWEVGGIGPLQNLHDVHGRPPERIGKSGP